MDSTIKMPYFAPECQLPCPLPTLEQIAASTDVLLEYSPHGQKRIVRVGDYFVKYGVRVKLTEGETMLFIKGVQKDFPVPQVYALYSAVENGETVNYIVMEYIPGKDLKECWPSLEPGEKLSIARQLRTHFDFLRSIPGPGYFGSVGRKPFNQANFWPETRVSSEEKKNVSGPFESEAELTESLATSMTRHWDLEDQKHRITFLRRVLFDVLANHKAVLTHGDLRQRNIILREDGSLVLIRWEYSGWYPEYMEYAMAILNHQRFADDYSEHLTTALDSYNGELGWVDIVLKSILYGG